MEYEIITDEIFNKFRAKHECGGELQFTGAIESNPKRYIHRCDKCNKVIEIEENKFPHVKSSKYDSEEDTRLHISLVSHYMGLLCNRLKYASSVHDMSKLNNPEKEIFDIYTPKLKGTTYGSDEYKQYLNEMKKALNHHYENNAHHPEHFSNGISGMTLVDLTEMICDWYAATKRHDDGDIYKSLQINQARFNYSDELKSILKNTVDLIKGWE